MLTGKSLGTRLQEPTVGTAIYIISTQDMDLESRKSEMAPVAMAPIQRNC